MDTSPQAYALLIGIDHYLPNTLNYPSLNGCVQDAIHVKKLLQQKLPLPNEHIITLLAPNEAFTTSHAFSPQSSKLPTYNAIVKAFHSLLAMARPGDFFYLYFAGHGAQATSLLSEDKETDEVLVPMDIGNTEARYFHDVELAYLLKKMEEAELVVTVIFDCCFSGGTTRGSEGITIRGRRENTVDKSLRPGESSVASLPILTQTWRRLPKGSLRGFHKLVTRGYVLLAACGEKQFAYEYPHDEYDGHGAFTYWLLDSLHHLSANTTYRALHHRIQAKVSSEFHLQSPLILGDADRLVFGSDRLQTEPTVNVIRIEKDQQLRLTIGKAQMIGKGAKFAVYPAEVTDFSQEEHCLAIVEIVHPGGTTSRAKVIKAFRPDPIEPGAHAILRDSGDVGLQRLIRLFHDDNLPPAIPQDEALQAIERMIQLQQQKFVRLAEPHERADFQIAVNKNQMYEIWDQTGITINTLSTSLPIHAPGSATKLVRILTHLTKYHNIQRLDNTNSRSPLAGKLVVSLLGKQTDYEPGEKPAPEPFAKIGGNPRVKPEEWIFLQVKNSYSRDLNVTIVDLAPDWSITQIFPYDEAYHILAPGDTYILDLQASLPNGLTRGTDTLKVFATLGETDFRCLELPALDRQRDYRGGTTSYYPTTPLEELLFALMEDTPRTRNFNSPGVHPAWEWVTAQLAVDVQQA
jgi:hypothetical protein